MTQELKKCPFCNGEGEAKIHYCPYYISIVCKECGSSAVMKQSIEEATHCWNTRPSDNKDGLVALDEGHCIQYLSSQDKMRGNLSTKATVEAVYCAVRLLCSTFGTPPKRDVPSVNKLANLIYETGEITMTYANEVAKRVHDLLKQEKLI